MPRPETKWKDRIFQERSTGAPTYGIWKKLETEAAENKARGRKLDTEPALSTVQRHVKLYDALPKKVQREYRLFSWPESITNKEANIPWEASRPLLDLLRYLDMNGVPRPTVGFAQTYLRTYQAIRPQTGAYFPPREAIKVTLALLRAEKGTGPVDSKTLREAAQWYAAYHPWLGDGYWLKKYEERVAKGAFPDLRQYEADLFGALGESLAAAIDEPPEFVSGVSQAIQAEERRLAEWRAEIEAREREVRAREKQAQVTREWLEVARLSQKVTGRASRLLQKVKDGGIAPERREEAYKLVATVFAKCDVGDLNRLADELERAEEEELSAIQEKLPGLETALKQADQELDASGLIEKPFAPPFAPWPFRPVKGKEA